MPVWWQVALIVWLALQFSTFAWALYDDYVREPRRRRERIARVFE